MELFFIDKIANICKYTHTTNKRGLMSEQQIQTGWLTTEQVLAHINDAQGHVDFYYWALIRHNDGEQPLMIHVAQATDKVQFSFNGGVGEVAFTGHFSSAKDIHQILGKSARWLPVEPPAVTLRVDVVSTG